ncbi:MAG: ribosomal-processing cysteine protease Prp [Bacteroides sp.]|nr:ribosomal-processing cysteine protease Prp [Bacillota bacterium]MCM1394330.1 ribosomal-processing cysteine protease Prp [[Eubacterium] siraeum]MCM1455151.1 ribosomal-processing cysteine protease Prp [Bacteroides sp.]
MVNVKFSTQDGKFVGVECIGHCEYACEGEDVVCAALSSVVQTAVLGLMSVVGINVAYETNAETGYLKAVLPKSLTKADAHDADVILRTAYVGVSDLHETFSDYISLEVE